MKLANIIFTSSALFLASLALSGCENTSVSGSVSYGMGIGYGYPMYYGRGHHHTDIIVVKPPRKERSRPSKPISRPSRPKRR